MDELDKTPDSAAARVQGDREAEARAAGRSSAAEILSRVRHLRAVLDSGPTAGLRVHEDALIVPFPVAHFLFGVVREAEELIVCWGSYRDEANFAALKDSLLIFRDDVLRDERTTLCDPAESADSQPGPK